MRAAQFGAVRQLTWKNPCSPAQRKQVAVQTYLDAQRQAHASDPGYKIFAFHIPNMQPPQGNRLVIDGPDLVRFATDLLLETCRLGAGLSSLLTGSAPLSVEPDALAAFPTPSSFDSGAVYCSVEPQARETAWENLLKRYWQAAEGNPLTLEA